MNNIFLGQSDPLLANMYSSYNTNTMDNGISQQMLMQQMYNNAQKDWIGSLDELSKSLDTDVLNSLADNNEYISLSGALQAAIQAEIMSYVKGNLNMNPNVVNNIKRQIEIINKTKEAKDAENRQNISELNDYMKNYSHITFDEYKEIKRNGTGSTSKNRENDGVAKDKAKVKKEKNNQE